ncbi:unnamed protein product [Parnassius mnemosyne]|uniref:Tc1-like transposase DDE domain-containing protein n=1 Tax=Parnassius mnemosyne TaxID=213953 RepID=A0AAV1LKJ1_9NEOP
MVSGSEDNVLRTSKKKRRQKPVTGVDVFDADAIRNHIYGYYTRNEFPTRRLLLVSLKEAGLFKGGKTALSKLLHEIGFEYKKTNKRKILMERFDLIIKRSEFLREARKIESWDNVVFVDETWLNANHTVSRSWTDETKASTSKVPIGKGSRLIICHAGSAGSGFFENGVLAFASKSTSDYHEEMDTDTFTNWFENQLLPSLPEPSIIIMDNASYHSKQVNKAPTQADKKADLVAWLHQNGIETTAEMLKSDLVKLVRENKTSRVRYEVDEIALAHGHRVLRIPSYHCQYNTIELIWAQIKGYAARNDTTPPFSTNKMMGLLKDPCSKITKEDWVKVVEKTRILITEHYERDIRVDTIIENEIVIQVTDSDDSSGESGSESE